MREIKIHNTLSGRLEDLAPRDPAHVGIYACGPTVYARIHIGNARPYVVFALYKRFLEHEGYKVTLVENITDINDKIYDAAGREDIASAQLAKQMTTAYIEDTDRLALGRPDREPLASESIESIVNLIQSLINRGFAYAVEGDVYFKVRDFNTYGALSNRRVEDMSSQEPGEYKQDPLDFALWKAHKADEDTAWDAPWGKGRPGWHIECSAMAEDYLGLEFDIHGGGSDLIFPHHENEIAQTEAARGRGLARIWMHNGMVRLGDEKMAKSVGNIKPLHELLDQCGRDAVVMYFLAGHYRQPLLFSEAQLDDARARLRRIREFARLIRDLASSAEPEWAVTYREQFFAALADDFNTPKALAAAFELIAEGNSRAQNGESIAGIKELFAEILYCLGLETLNLEKSLDSGSLAEAKKLLDEREEARKARDFDRADRARARIEELGFEVRDSAEGSSLVPRDR